MRMPVQTEKKNGKQESFVEPTDKELQEISDQAAPKAANQVAKTLNTTLGVNVLDMKTAVPALRRRLRDPEVDNVSGTEPIPADKKQLYPGQTELKTHRYTIDVPDEGEYSVLNLGHGDPNRELPDAGISARTKNHIHFHTKNYDHASMLAIGGPTRAARHQIDDAANALGSNTGISAITNGHLWAESAGVANVASRKNQAIFRSHLASVRVQSDLKNVEVSAAATAVVGGVKSVNIVSSSDLNQGENKYGEGFKENLVESSGVVAGKDLVTMLDIISASVTAVKAFKDKDWFYQKGKLSQEKKANDKGKLMVDAVKALSSIGRYVAGKVVGGQVKIAADTFASMTGMVGASMYGHLSASVSSLLSASVVGGTASLKGLNWASVWAANGVSVRTVHGSASIRSEEGKVTLSAKDEIGISSRKGVNIGGDNYAELKAGNGPVFIASPKKTTVCAGEESGMGVILDGRTAYIGDVTNANEATGKLKKGTCIIVVPEKENIYFKTAGCGVQLKKKNVNVKGDKVDVKGDKVNIC